MNTTDEEVISTEVDRRALACASGAGVVALLAVSAVASRAPLSSSGGLGHGGAPPPATASPWALALVAAGAVVALIGLLTHLGWRVRRRRPRDRDRIQTVRVPWLVRIAVLLIPLALGAVFVVAAIQGSHDHAALPRLLTPQPGARELGSGGGRPVAHSSFALPGWVPFAVLALLLAGGGAFLLAPWFPARRRSQLESEPRSAGAPLIGEAISLSLEDLRGDPDHRRAVIASYARMEAALAAAGLPRRAAEAPREYMVRALGSLQLQSAPLATLTRLFERAKFSLGRFDSGMRDQAIAALLALREELG